MARETLSLLRERIVDLECRQQRLLELLNHVDLFADAHAFAGIRASADRALLPFVEEDVRTRAALLAPDRLVEQPKPLQESLPVAQERDLARIERMRRSIAEADVRLAAWRREHGAPRTATGDA